MKTAIANMGYQSCKFDALLTDKRHGKSPKLSDSQNAQATVKLLKAIDAANPSAPHIRLIVDNTGCYHAYTAHKI